MFLKLQKSEKSQSTYFKKKKKVLQFIVTGRIYIAYVYA